ncbi:MAG TPA: amylo-alpha-1,6-glucosidase [Cytophagaceae bacterium]|jgi:predicted glycogen debranching enzyme|nr:amylo-alpha-1,6-glucosidase [Cytophagaceae bacterium]
MEDTLRIELPAHYYQDVKALQSSEWLETFGNGSYASGTYSGINTRKYHGIFNVSRRPPVERTMILSRLEETIITNSNTSYPLFSNQFPGSITPDGYKNLVKAGKNWGPFFDYKIGDYILHKEVMALQAIECLAIRYRITGPSPAKFQLQLRPFISGRDIHSLSKKNTFINKQVQVEQNKIILSAFEGLSCSVQSKGIQFENQDAGWYLSFLYKEEELRGFDPLEDLYTPGILTIDLEVGIDKYVLVGLPEHQEIDQAKTLWENEVTRRKALIKPYAKAPAEIKQLALSGDQFLVSRAGGHQTIIAGYHWFADWGRDTMIALPGLCMESGNYDRAKAILETFSKFVSRGMLPNRFPDQGEEPEYNSVDAALWYVVAVYQYWKKSHDENTVRMIFYPVVQAIREAYLKGTAYNIHADSDYLIYAGKQGVQLTWMDAKIGDWVVTPRIGKPIEINALWYNCHKILTEMAFIFSATEEAVEYSDYASKILSSFKGKFINPLNGALYDVVNDDGNDSSVRPNMLFALSLPFPLLSKEEGKSVLSIVEQELLTSKGVRSLTPYHPDHQVRYGGDVLSRDGAYHQGTVWGWLLGPYYDACLYVREERGKEQVIKHLAKALEHCYEAGIGTYSEIFDSGLPHKPNGCISQAWSVSEILRIYNKLETY